MERARIIIIIIIVPSLWEDDVLDYWKSLFTCDPPLDLEARSLPPQAGRGIGKHAVMLMLKRVRYTL